METSVIEAEIAELSRRIAEKRRALEASHGIVEEKELVRSAVKERVVELAPIGSSTPATRQSSSQSQTSDSRTTRPSYLDSLGPEAIERLNSLIQLAVDHGLKKALAEVADEDPFIVDAFHDAIADRYYEELKKHKVL